MELTTFRGALDALDTGGKHAQRLGALWAVRAQNEHASIAAFDRFALGLLATGAPPGLLQGAHAAAQDEIRHAELCFALASAYAGRPLGPGPLDLRDAPAPDLELRALCLSTVVEGCVGETLSALEAERCAEHAGQAAVKLALDAIALDEARHAELAWATVKWGLTLEPHLAPALAEAFSHAFAAAGGPPRYACDDAAFARHGFLSPAEAHALREDAIRRVLRPAAEALLSV